MSEKTQCNQCSKTFRDDESLEKHKRSAHPVLTGSPEKKMEELRDYSIEVIWQFLHSDGKDAGLRALEQSARQALSNYTRSKATESNREQTNFLLARSLSENQQQLAEYIRITMPNSPILKALPSKADGNQPS